MSNGVSLIIGTHYSDPLGEMPERPRTAARKTQGGDFENAELGDLLPE